MVAAAAAAAAGGGATFGRSGISCSSAVGEGILGLRVRSRNYCMLVGL